MVGIAYYLMILQNQQKSQQTALETRQAQLLSQLSLNFNTVDTLTTYMTVLNWDWEDYDDFETKYGSDVSPKLFAMKSFLWNQYNTAGKLVHEGLLNLEIVYPFIGEAALYQWVKWKDIIAEQRRRYYTDDYMSDWEYLVDELMKKKRNLGYTWQVPEDLGRYQPSNR